MSETPITDLLRGMLDAVPEKEWVFKNVEKLETELAAANELHARQLAAVSAASLANTRASAKEQRIDFENDAFTQAYTDTVLAVEREMAERERAETAERELAECRASHEELRQALTMEKDYHRVAQSELTECRECLSGTIAVIECCGIPVDDEQRDKWQAALDGRGK